MASPNEVTRLLEEVTQGNDKAVAKLLPIVYDELRRLADRYLRDEPCGHTLQPTALVHEVYLRLVGRDDGTWENRTEFFAVAAKAMRHLLIDHARRRRATKRGGDRIILSLDEVAEPTADRSVTLIALDDALTELAAVDPNLCRVVELRFFGGLNVEESARAMGVSSITIKRRWKLAKGWLQREMTRGR